MKRQLLCQSKLPWPATLRLERCCPANRSSTCRLSCGRGKPTSRYIYLLKSTKENIYFVYITLPTFPAAILRRYCIACFMRKTWDMCALWCPGRLRLRAESCSRRITFARVTGFWQIDDLRRERVLFDTIYKKMERELSDRKKMMANVIEV